jgi:hypothetical protein
MRILHRKYKVAYVNLYEYIYLVNATGWHLPASQIPCFPSVQHKTHRAGSQISIPYRQIGSHHCKPLIPHHHGAFPVLNKNNTNVAHTHLGHGLGDSPVLNTSGRRRMWRWPHTCTAVLMALAAPSLLLLRAGSSDAPISVDERVDGEVFNMTNGEP